MSERIVPGIKYLFQQINEINPAIRFDFRNHSPYFPTYVTGIVDTFPIIMEKSGPGSCKPSVYSGKYKDFALKFMLTIDFFG